MYCLLCVLLLVQLHTDSGSISVYTWSKSFNFKDIFVILMS